ncbi:unnamed protein product [Aureobasidium vineae]|uniref:Peptidase A1 domain-containing protein n=1 Tax=Aureobasidium vineae TaxID=2773715 RepID=A0A9N8JB30_9PEZI|nr:unnamed protein product [Aureobasidium vineae]
MSISFQSGPSISIANSQVVQPDATILSNGSINYDSTLNEVNIIPLQSLNANDMVQLGRQFLSGAYLMVNEDAGTFTLWQATDSLDENLVAVNEKGEVFNSTCASTTSNNTAVNPSESSGSAPSVSPSSPASKTPTSTIVGSVVGSVAGVVLLICLGVFLWVRSRKNKVLGANSSSSHTHDAGEKAIPLYSYGAAEKTNSTHELWGNPVNEMSGHLSPKERSKHPTVVHELGDSY